MRRNAKLIFGFAVKALLIIVITFLAAELSLRLYHYFNPVFVFPSSSYERYRGKPFSQDYAFRLNSKGFKDIEFNKEKEPEHIGSWELVIPSRSVPSRMSTII